VSALAVAESSLVDEIAGLARAYEESQTFISMLAHELRTRLKVTERALSSSTGDGVAAALENTRTVQALSESLLDLARGEAGEQGDVGAAARSVAAELAWEAGLLGAEILVDDELPAVPLPHGMLETLLRNLVTNALDAGASFVHVFARSDGTICVRDDGRGVPPEEAAKIFGAYSGKPGGAGLGLTLCREILRRRGGDIWLELPSTFCFRVA
jgi:two-component system, sensor histidine kinase